MIAETNEELAQALWDVYAALGFDTDGDPTPRSLAFPKLSKLVLDAAAEHRLESDTECFDMLAEIDRHHELIAWMRDRMEWLLRVAEHTLWAQSDKRDLAAIRERLNREVAA